MEFKGTQGPWTVLNFPNSPKHIAVINSKGGIYIDEKTEENEANAKLIAAAPELLGALQIAMLCSNFTESEALYGRLPNHWTNIIRNAVNKAL